MQKLWRHQQESNERIPHSSYRCYRKNDKKITNGEDTVITATMTSASSISSATLISTKIPISDAYVNNLYLFGILEF